MMGSLANQDWWALRYVLLCVSLMLVLGSIFCWFCTSWGKMRNVYPLVWKKIKKL